MIKLKNTQEQVELVKAMASKNGQTAMNARETFAQLVTPVVQKVLQLQGQARQILTDWTYDENDSPEFPLDQYYASSVDTVSVWSQNMAGGLGSSLVTGLSTLKLATYRLDSAVHLLERNIAKGRLPYVSLALNRLSQELLVKQELNRWLILMTALGQASTNSQRHVIGSTTANVLQVDDFNRLITRSQLINVAFNGGTPENTYTNGCTDMWMSPEQAEQIRGFAYQPMNTRGVPNSDESTAVPLPDSVRSKLYESSGVNEIYGINLHVALEFGIGRLYNTLFAKQISGTIVGGGNTGTFAAANDEIIFGVDLSKDMALLRPTAVNADNGSDVTVQVDDQWVKRSGKVGWFTSTEEGVVVIDARTLTGLVI